MSQPPGETPPASKPEASSATADSSGLPWAGRRLPASGFADDHGEPDPNLLALLRRPTPRSNDDEAMLLAVLARCRVLVPLVVAPAAKEGHAPPNRSSRELAAVTLTGRDGQRALPVFTGLPALTAWDAAARPVPVTASEAAHAALHQGCDVLVVDVASSFPAVLRPSMVSALAGGEPWVPAYRDPGVVRSAAAAVEDEPAVVRHELAAGAPGTDAVVLTLWLRRGLDAEAVHQLTLRTGRRLGAAAELRSRVDDLVLRIEAAKEE